MHSRAWLAQRALLAIALLVGFYVFAIAIALGLLATPFLSWKYVGTVGLQVVVACIGAGLTILWSLVPRRTRFTPPGPRIDESNDPALVAAIRRVADSTHQPMPSEIYLLNAVNAFVTQRGGVMGLGGRRIMGIGLPLLQAVTVREFEAIVAHEFGHYCAGDVRLGPWIYKTRAAIVRTIAGVGKSVVAVPFAWYARQFLRLTHAVSRRQEFLADEIAARVSGAATIASALKRVTVATPLYSSYVNSELGPVFAAGYLPPIATGFNEYLTSPCAERAAPQILAAAETREQTGPFDTHPSLRDRLAALDALVASAPPDTSPAASTLLNNPDAHARTLVEAAAGSERVGNLAPIRWTDVGASVFARRWREAVKLHASRLNGLTTDTIPCGRDAFIRAGSDLVRRDETNINADQRIARACEMFAVALGVVLLDDGWSIETRPGAPLTLVRGAERFEPFKAMFAVASGAFSADLWRLECHRLGIAERPLGTSPSQHAAS